MKNTILISFLSMASLSAFAQTLDGPVNTSTVAAPTANCRRAPNMPAKAVQVWPQEAYIPMEDKSCAPCYQYRGIHGTMVMECPFILPKEAGSTLTAEDVAVQGQNTYTGNYPQCRQDLHMPKNAKMVYPTAAYINTGNPACAPCYEYTTKRGLKVMECPNALLTQ